MNGGQEVASGFVVASRDGAELFELGEEVFYQMACFIEVLVVFALNFAIGFRRNHRDFTGVFQHLQDTLVGIEAFVGEHDPRFDLRQQHVGAVQIAGLTAGQMKASRVAQGVDRGMNLGAQPAFAAPDGLIGAPFFSAPALCWWARTMVASIIAYSLSASAAKC